MEMSKGTKNAMFFRKLFMCGIVGCHCNVGCLLHQRLVDVDGKIRWVVSCPRNLISSQEDIVCVRIEANIPDIAYLTGSDSILPLHAQD